MARPVSARRSTSAPRSPPGSCAKSARRSRSAHQLGMSTVLWCYLRNSEFKQGDVDYHVAADLTGQANHLGVTIEADIIKQKLPTTNGGYNAFKGYGKTSKLVYDELTTDHPIDLCRWQVANCYLGRSPAHQQWWRVQGRERPGRRRLHRGGQQARRWHGLDLGPQGVPASDVRGHRAPQRRPGRLPRHLDHDRLIDDTTAEAVVAPPGSASDSTVRAASRRRCPSRRWRSRRARVRSSCRAPRPRSRRSAPRAPAA